jgi:predicted ATPase
MNYQNRSQGSKNGSHLHRLILNQFKSLKSASFELAPLTLLVGQNSVGKSSVFQAILSIAQWTATGASGTYALNGDLVRLGKFSDVVTRGVDKLPTTNYVSLSLYSSLGTIGFRLIEESENRSVGRIADLHFLSSSGQFSFFHWEEADLTISIPPTSIQMVRGNGIPGPNQEFGSYNFQATVPQDHLDSFEGKSIFEKLLRSKWKERRPLTHGIQATLKQIVVGMSRASITYGKPMKLVAIEDYCSSLINSEMDQISKFIQSLLKERANILDRLVFPGGRFHTKSAFDYFPDFELNLEGKLQRRVRGEQFFLGYSVPDLGLSAEKLSDPNLESDFEIPEEIFNKALQVLEDKFGDNVFDLYEFDAGPSTIPWFSSSLPIEDYEDYSLPERTPIDELGEDIGRFEDFLHTKLSYLGPLRVNGFSTAFLGSLRNTIFPVGPSGEITALLIMQEMDKQVERDYPVHNQGIVKTTFKTALESWLSLFTVPDAEIVVTDRDKNGIQIEVSGRTLDQYGTGASQVLPILALALSRKSGDVVLIEQPELHLHPGGQQFLADFFMESMKLGIQIILETHSEYMVNRIRRGIVFGNIANEDVLIVNFEQKVDGTASVNSVALNGSGGFADWPQGFFAQTEEDLLDIIQALEDR